MDIVFYVKGGDDDAKLHFLSPVSVRQILLAIELHLVFTCLLGPHLCLGMGHRLEISSRHALIF